MSKINFGSLKKVFQARPGIRVVASLNRRSHDLARRFDYLFSDKEKDIGQPEPEPNLPLIQGGTTREDLDRRKALIDRTKDFVVAVNFNLSASREDLRVDKGLDELIKQGTKRDGEAKENRDKARKIVEGYYNPINDQASSTEGQPQPEDSQ